MTTLRYNTAPLKDRLLYLVTHLQFAWWLGHVSTVVMSFLFYLCYFTHEDVATWAYYTSLLGAIVSYMIAGLKSTGPFQLSRQMMERLAANDSIQYMMLALIWYSQPPLLVTLIPFTAFAMLHGLNYLNTAVLPACLGHQDKKSWIIRQTARLDQWARQHYTQVMMYVARWEVIIILGWVLLQTILFQISFFTWIVYAMFLRNRYALSREHQQAFSHLRKLLDQLFDQPQCHAGIRRLYYTIRERVIQFGMPVYQQQQQQ
jgi:hypothetical protein